MHRRTFIRGMCLGGAATFALPLVRFAQVPGRGKLVFILLRGGFDGLAAVVPVGDPDYAATRGSMAFGLGEVTPLDGLFGLAPGLAPWRALWEAEELVAVHAMAIPYRTRSHFAGQAVLETGLARPVGSSGGWLNRLLQLMDGERAAIAIGQGIPRSLQGPEAVSTWSPTQLGELDDAYLERLRILYGADATLHERFEAALRMREIVPDMRGQGGGGQLATTLAAAARFLRHPGGPNIAALDFSGWDTHAAQGMQGGRLDERLSQLADGVMMLRTEMGPDWDETTVVIMTEFGRTARPNGTEGTDHGTGGAGFVIGPRVGRSRVIADWPGLSERSLYENRDVRSTLDTRSLLKGVIAGVFDLSGNQADRVFPDSEGAPGLWSVMS